MNLGRMIALVVGVLAGAAFCYATRVDAARQTRATSRPAANAGVGLGGRSDEYDDGGDDVYEDDAAVADDDTSVYRTAGRTAGDDDGGTRRTVAMDAATAQPALSRGQWVDRERKKQLRLMQIQQQIMSSLGFNRAPNMSAVPQLSSDDMTRLKASYERLNGRVLDGTERQIQQVDFLAKRIQALPPSCPAMSDDRATQDGVPAFKLHFNVDFDQARHSETRLSSASLKLRKKSRGTESSASSSSSSSSLSTSISRRRRVGAATHGVTSEPSAHVTSSNDGLKVAVYSFSSRTSRRHRRVAKSLIKSLTIRSDYVGWISININSTVDHWLRRPNRNFGLQIVVTDARTQQPIDPFTVFEPQNCSLRTGVESVLLPMTIQDTADAGPTDTNDSVMHDDAAADDQTTPGQPFLELVTVHVPRLPGRGRSKRHLPPSASGCSMENIYVSFAELGWADWILQPQGFETGFCTGSCNRYIDGDEVAKQTLSEFGRPVQTDAGCCMPSKLKSLGVVYYGRDSRLSMLFLQDLIVTECSCRTM